MGDLHLTLTSVLMLLDDTTQLGQVILCPEACVLATQPSAPCAATSRYSGWN